MLALGILLAYVVIGIGCAYYLKHDFDDSGLILVAILWPIMTVILIFLVIFDLII